MAARGGVRPGAGRPVGSLGAPAKLSRVRATEIARSGEAPIDVMLENMLFWHRQAGKMTEQLQGIVITDAEDREEAIKLLKALLASRENSQRCAVDLAPYVHARLASITVKGDKNNPIPLEVASTMDPKKAAEAYQASLNMDKD